VGHERRQHRQPDARREGHDGARDLLGTARGHRLAAARAVLLPELRVENAQIVVDLGDRPHRGSRVRRRALLLDRDRRREAAQGFDLRPIELPEELPRVGAQRLDVAPLPFGVEGVERQARLAGPARPREDDERALGDREPVDVEVVLAGPPDLHEVRFARRAGALRRRGEARRGGARHGGGLYRGGGASSRDRDPGAPRAAEACAGRRPW
jgi:hypothetical protein